MARWTRLAVGLLMTVGFAAAQSAPAVSSPAPVAENTANSAPAASSAQGSEAAAKSAGSSPAGCPAGASWFCVTQTLQRLMFNLDGTHKADAEIAQSVPNAIQQMIQDGVLKPSNAPKKSIKGFDDANDFLIHYMSDAPSTAAAPGDSPSAPAAPATETASVTPPAAGPENTSAPASVDCPKDKPWLCPVTGPTPAQAKTPAGTPSPSAPSAQSAAAPPQAGAAPNDQSKESTGKAAESADKTPFYVYGPNDVVGVTVAGETMATGTFTIMPDGRISMPLLTEFKAAGLTGPQLKDTITRKLRDEAGILEPVVNVQLLRSNSKHYTMLGAVMRPGPVPLIQDTTLLDALSVAGFQEFAKKTKITVRRGTKVIVTFNYKNAVRGKDLDKNIMLEDGDVVYVPGD